MSTYFDSVANSWDANPAKIERASVTASKVKDIHFTSRESIVDFGGGTGLLGVQLRETFSQVHLADASAKMLEVAQGKIEASNIDNIYTHHIDRLSELTSKHSAIVTLMTLHHVLDLGQFFSDAYDVLESDGTLIIADLYKEDGSFHKHHSEFEGHNGFDVPELVSLSEASGFSVLGADEYYSIRKTDTDGIEKSYPLFFFVAQKPL